MAAGTRRQLLIAASVALIAAAAGFVFHSRYRSTPDPALLQVALKDLSGDTQRLDQWRGKVLVVNFWATWCAPCRKEIPEFVHVQERYRDRGLQFVGIAIDQPDNVARFTDEVRFNYPVLIGEIDAIEFSRKLGNRYGALPFTAIFDRSGNLVRVESGALDEPKILSLIDPLL